MDAVDRQLLDQIQRAFPLEPRPFEALGHRVGVGEAEVLRRIDRMKKDRLVRQISAIFNTGGLGYRSSLVAMAVSEEALEKAARAVNAYPGVSHNYLRPGSYNMWFTVAVPPGESLEEVVAGLSEKAGGWPFIILPAIKKYKLAVVLDVLDEPEGETSTESAAPQVEAGRGFEPTPENVRIVRCIQEDLPLGERPFRVWAVELGREEEELLALIRRWTERGWIRRFAAVLNHREVGFGANGMVVWRCDPDRIDSMGKILAGHPEVSHCYHRPAHPEWPYNLYAMIHGRSEEECRAVADRLAAAVGHADYRILFSTREFKKIRLKLFWE
ncbi:transcriptional regulator, AsnC family [Desulfacinum infernum DSM 9756]|uniref:siroheme decarboxylase n=1 Tax=Desulfacinum infernum DSM 9756 TaxID=1121391 RepID=A0A1M5IL07_9BACT|nr:AsnC family transcriptional regulator [Desulfacinum infernum]SHG28729.1 transcriptional regulator, AsnC family [Desulfacinum infernum DSM 9756]